MHLPRALSPFPLCPPNVCGARTYVLVQCVRPCIRIHNTVREGGRAPPQSPSPLSSIALLMCAPTNISYLLGFPPLGGWSYEAKFLLPTTLLLVRDFPPIFLAYYPFTMVWATLPSPRLLQKKSPPLGPLFRGCG